MHSAEAVCVSMRAVSVKSIMRFMGVGRIMAFLKFKGFACWCFFLAREFFFVFVLGVVFVGSD